MNKISISILLKELEQALNRKDGYIAGAKGQNPRTGYLDLSCTKIKKEWQENGKFYTQYNKGYSKQQQSKALYWRSNATRVWDLFGLIDGIYELHSGISISNHHNNVYEEWCSTKSMNMDKMPLESGVVVFRHNPQLNQIVRVGILWKIINNHWHVIEAKGTLYGVVSSSFNKDQWNCWGYADNYFDYSPIVSEPKYETGAANAQKLLNMADEPCPINNLWDAQTIAAINHFQRKNGLMETSSLDSITKNVLQTYIAKNKKIVQVFNYTYLYKEPHIGAKAIIKVAPGDRLDYAKICQGKWIKVFYNNEFVWINSKYAQICQ